MTRKDELSEIQMNALKAASNVWKRIAVEADICKKCSSRRELYILRRYHRTIYMAGYMDGATDIAMMATEATMKDIGTEMDKLQEALRSDLNIKDDDI